MQDCGDLNRTELNWIEQVTQDAVGELYLNSMDRDGTGQGYDLELLNLLPASMPKPVILAGGVVETGTLRNIKIQRNDQVVGYLDLYPLITGNDIKCINELLI